MHTGQGQLRGHLGHQEELPVLQVSSPSKLFLSQSLISLTSGTRAAWLLGCAQAGSCLRRNARAGSRPYFLKFHQIFRNNVPGRTGERQGRAAQLPHMRFPPLLQSWAKLFAGGRSLELASKAPKLSTKGSSPTFSGTFVPPPSLWPSTDVPRSAAVCFQASPASLKAHRGSCSRKIFLT